MEYQKITSLLGTTFDNNISDAYIVVKGTITVTNPDNNAYDKKLAFKNNALFVSCISKINNTLIDNRLRYCNAYVQFT